VEFYVCNIEVYLMKFTVNFKFGKISIFISFCYISYFKRLSCS